MNMTTPVLVYCFQQCLKWLNSPFTFSSEFNMVIILYKITKQVKRVINQFHQLRLV